MGSILGLKIGLAIFCAMAALAAPIFAEDAKTALPAINADDLKKALGLSVYLQAGYTYNSDAGAIGSEQEQNDMRLFDHKPTASRWTSRKSCSRRTRPWGTWASS